MLKIGSLDSLTFLFASFANNTFAEQGSFLWSSFFFSFSHLRLLHFGLHSFSKIEKLLSFTTFTTKSTIEKSFIKIVLPHYFLQAEFFHKRKASSKCVDQRVASLPFLVPSSSLCIHVSSFLLLKTKCRANIASPYHSRVLFHLLIIFSAGLKNTRILCQDEVSAEKDVGSCKFLSVMMYLWKVSLFRATTNMGKCIVAIVEDLLAPKIINTVVPLLFAG